MTRRRRRPASPRTTPRAATAAVPRAEPLEPRTHLSASLVADVQQGSGDASPTILTAGGSRLFFRAWDGTTVGNEPYTLPAQPPPNLAPRATLLKDINPNGDSVYRKASHAGPTPPTPAIAVGDGFYFSAFNDTVGLELYHTDGTAAGTRLVKDVVPGRANSSPDNFFLAGDILYFTAGPFGIEPGTRSLYRTDGTDAGTTVVRRVSATTVQGEPVPVPTSMALLDGVPYFTTGAGLFRLDPAGAVTVWSNVGFPGRSLTAFDGALFFKVGNTLFRSDGTAEGTLPFIGVGAPPAASDPQKYDNLKVSGGLLYFAAQAPNSTTPRLWQSDGTTEGTRQVTNAAGAAFLWPNHLTDVGGTLYFTASPPGVAESVWKTQGTPETTLAAYTISGASVPNPAGRPFQELAAVGDTLYFTNFAPGNGAGLWRTSVTSQPTYVAAPFAVPQSLTPLAGRLYFVARNVDGLELWSTDGTAAGTAQVQDLNARHATNRTAPEGLTEINGRLVFATDNGFGSRRLYSAAGTAGSVTELASLSRAFNPVRLGDRLYFVSGANGEELWTTDGTDAGTDRIRSFPPDPQRGNGIGRLSSVAGMLLFFAADDAHGRELWVSDGTLAGARFLHEFTPGTAGTFTTEDFSWPRMVEAGGAAYFVLGNSIYKTDGTPAGTLLLRTFTGGPVDHPVALGDRVLFDVETPSFYGELWATDGTVEGTTIVHPQLTSHSFEALGDFVAFWGNGGLWRSDGTPAGTYALSEFPSGPVRNPNFLTAWNGAIYFRADPTGVWKTDGTKVGTVPVMTPAGTQARISNFGPFVPLGGHLYFAGADTDYGAELWRTEGTSATAVRVTDILPGPGSSGPGNLVAMGDALYFFAEDASTAASRGATSLARRPSRWRGGASSTTTASSTGATPPRRSPTWPPSPPASALCSPAGPPPSPTSPTTRAATTASSSTSPASRRSRSPPPTSSSAPAAAATRPAGAPSRRRR